MGAFLILNDLDIKVDNQSCTLQEIDQGSVYETQNGALICAVARKIRTWSMTSSLLTLPELQALKQWIFGQNVYWGFNQTLFSKYTGFSNAVANPLTTYATTTPKFTGEYYGVTGSTSGPFWDVSAMNWKKFEPYTFCGFGYNLATTTWKHYTHLSYFGADLPTAASTYPTTLASQFSVDGTGSITVQRGAAPSVFSTADFTALACIYSDPLGYDATDTPSAWADYCLFKGCHLTPAMISTLSSRTKKLPGFPYLELSGDLAMGRTTADPLIVTGRCDGEKFVYANGQTMGRLSFSLLEANLQPFDDLA